MVAEPEVPDFPSDLHSLTLTDDEVQLLRLSLIAQAAAMFVAHWPSEDILELLDLEYRIRVATPLVKLSCGHDEHPSLEEIFDEKAHDMRVVLESDFSPIQALEAIKAIKDKLPPEVQRLLGLEE